MDYNNGLMGKVIFILYVFFICSLTMSCKYDNIGKNDFYNSQYRLGLWTTVDKKDTLQFIDASSVIRKGYYYSYEKYTYRISGSNLYLRLQGSETETQHPILTSDGKTVKIGNMYLSIEFNDNSGTFIKI